MNSIQVNDANRPEVPVASQTDEDILADARKYLELCTAADGENHKEGMIDLQFVAGIHWPEKQKQQRALDGRPALVVNKLPTFLNNVTNAQRQNRGAIKVSPVGSGADIDVAEVIQGMTRHIEYESNADVATDTAVNSSAAIGYGYFRIMPEYEGEKSFNQILRYKRIRNAFTVAFDPTSEEPDGSDQQRCMIHTKVLKSEFTRDYPEAKLTDATLNVGMATPYLSQWLSDKFVRVAEFYRIEKQATELVLMSDGGIFFSDEMPDKAQLTALNITEVRRRPTFKKKVMWYKLTALEILERTEIMCKWIPVFPVFGSEIDLDGKVIRSGLIRNARDPQLMYDYWMTSATEEIALRTKTPFIGAEGQFEGHEEQWNSANVRNYSYLEYKPTTVDGQLAPPPQRQPAADIPHGYLTMAVHANDNIKATTGLFDPSLGAEGNATSGKQEIAQQKQGSLANFHYQDGLLRTRRHAGRCIVDMIPHYYDTQRVVQIMREDEKVESVTINKPMTEDEQHERVEAEAKKGRKVAIQKVLNDMSTGEYAVVIDTGPSYNTAREQASEAMIQFGQSWPKLMDIAGDEVVKAMDWPGAQKIAQRIKNTIPPNIQHDPNDPEAGPPPLPPEVQQKMQEMEQALQELVQENQQLQAGVAKEQIKAESATNVATIDAMVKKYTADVAAETKKDVEEIKGYIALLVQKMQPPPEVASEAKSEMAED
jgi:hypothetical protein